MQYLQKINANKLTAWVVLLLVIKLLIDIYFPMAALDGPWYLSHAFSVINGHQFKNTFAADYIDFYNLPYLYGDLPAAFYFPFAHTSLNIYSIFIINFLLVNLLLYLCYKLYTIYKKHIDFMFMLFCGAVIFSPATYLQRPETWVLILILLFHLYLIKYAANTSLLYYIVTAFFITAALLIHPVGGIYMAVFFTVYSFENKTTFRQYFFTAVSAVIIFFIAYAPFVLINVTAWKLNFFTRGYSNDERSVSFDHVIQFYTYAYPFLGVCILYLSAYRLKRLVKEVGILLLFIVILLPFGRYYYYAYLFHLVLWRIALIEDFKAPWWKKIVAAIFILPGSIQVFGLPIFQLTENRAYAPTFTNVLRQSRNTALQNPQVKVWVSPSVAMAVIDQPNGRLHYQHYVDVRGEKPVIKNDIFLIENFGMKNYLEHFIDTSKDNLIVENIIPPVKGLQRLGLHESRSDSLGLWKVTVIKKLQ